MEDKVVRELREARRTGRTVEDLARDICQEQVPPHLLELAGALQAALDARRKDGD